MGKKIVIIGGGPGGYVAAIRAAQLGGEVTVIEKDRLGGTCLNIGCIPTKCLLHSAELIESLRTESEQIGVKVNGIELDFKQIIKHKDEVSAKLTSGVGGLLKINKVETIQGEARFKDQRTIIVRHPDSSETEMDADAFIIATGSVNFTPPIPGISDVEACVDSTQVLSLKELPKSMVVIGAGVIGMEIACAYRSFGTEVTIVEALDKILPMLDEDITAAGIDSMKKMGIEFHMQAPVQAVEKTADGAKVICKTRDGSEMSFEAEKVLVAIGRRSNTESLDLAAAGIENEKGSIIVNDRMQTNISGIYAIGDCVYGKGMLAHTASAMGEVASENICGQDAVYDQRTAPSCVYIMPEAASVGLTEAECRDKGIEYNVGRFPMVANGKALIMNGGTGLVKIITDKKYKEVLGLHIIGPRATDLISEGALAIGMEATSDEIIRTIHAHPTVSEAVREAALRSEGRAIHINN